MEKYRQYDPGLSSSFPFCSLSGEGEGDFRRIEKQKGRGGEKRVEKDGGERGRQE
jgi:hypothetical protein